MATTLLIYPEIRPPYDKVYSDITSGFSEKFIGNVEQLAISKDTLPDDLSLTLEKVKPQVVVALGNNSFNLYKQSSSDVPLILGATTHSNAPSAGIFMIPDAGVILKYLFMLAPEVKTIHVVKRAGQLDELLSLAEIELASRGVSLHVMESKSFQESASAFREILTGADQGDAVWILPGAGGIDNAVLSMALNIAWQKDLVLFSSNPLHVKRGLLFAVYPDNYNMGGSLAKLANEKLTNGIKPKMSPLMDVQVAVNERTSRHLGIEISGEMKEEIDLLLPAR